MAEAPQFVQAVVDAVVAAPAVGQERKARRKPKPDVGIIEIEIEDITIRAGSGADANMIAAIVQALKANR
jgi:transposase